MPQNPSMAYLDKALDGSKVIFKASNGARSDALKVLVVITDKKSNSMAQDVKKSAQRLDENGIRVIGIALGEEEGGELDDITDVKDDVIKTTESTSPNKIVEKIMERLLNSKSSTRFFEWFSFMLDVTCFCYIFMLPVDTSQNKGQQGQLGQLGFLGQLGYLGQLGHLRQPGHLGRSR